MRRIDRYFLLLSSVFLILGVSLGIGMGIAHDFQYAPVHAHINLLGFASMAVFGIVYRLYPELGRSKLAAVHLGLAAPSALLFPIGIYLSIAQDNPGLAIVASLLWFAGALVFFANLVRGLVLAKEETSASGAMTQDLRHA